MQASEKSFSFIKVQNYYEIPFFQRNYVWQMENWEELLNNLLDLNQNHFLGSIILKQKSVASSDIACFVIIDGQQRLTTLSILLRACYDTLMLYKSEYSNDVISSLQNGVYSQLFVTIDTFKGDRKVKIRHSHIDADSFEKVIKGLVASDEELQKIITPEEKGKGEVACIDNILLCYKYFRTELANLDTKDVRRLWTILTEEKYSFLVNIDLNANENEQAIFDTVNTAGVRLTSADTIKNAIFQKYIDIIKADDPNHYKTQEAIDLYKEYWESVFSDSVETSTYWNTQHQSGRLYRDNIEILLHSVAVIEGFFNPSTDKMSDLAQRYKDKIADFGKEDLKNFIKKIRDYAELYRKYLIDFDSSTQFTFNELFLRLIHISDILEVSTFHPYLLQLLYNNEKTPGSINFREKCEELERYILLHAICKATTKNYNKECLQLISGEKTVSELLTGCEDVTAERFDSGLRQVYSNKMASVILFWIELYIRNNNNSDLKELKYTHTLEHVMPQKWQQYWNAVSIPVYDRDGTQLYDNEKAAEVRGAAIYELGNMTLLNSKLNTSLRNYTFDKKVHGEGSKRGMKDLADLILTKDIIKNVTWNERNIYSRTSDLSDQIKTIWGISL